MGRTPSVYSETATSVMPHSTVDHRCRSKIRRQSSQGVVICVAARLSVVCTDRNFYHPGWTSYLGRLDPGRGQQRYHLRDCRSDVADRIHSRQPILHCSVWDQFAFMAQGGRCSMMLVAGNRCYSQPGAPGWLRHLGVGFLRHG